MAERLARLAAMRRSIGTVRGRSAAFATIVVGVALTIGALVSVAVVRSNLTDNVDQTLLQQATDRAQLIDQGTNPASLVNTLQEESLVWIGTPDGQVVAVGSSVIPLESPVPTVLDGVGGAELLVEERKPDETERERMTLRLASATTADGELVVITGAETELIDSTSNQMVLLFLIGIPIIMVMVGSIAWLTVGRALRPVDDIRRQTLEVSGASLSERVPVPSSRDEIHDLAVTMNDMLERLERHQVALRQFTSDASHELKSPVANLRALTETSQLADPEWPQLQARLSGEADRLRDLVENLLFLATQDDPSSRSTAMSGRVDLDELVFEEAELLAATGRVRIDLSGVSPATIDGNGAALSRLLRNLADNAARHAASTVSFEVEADATSQTVRVAVIDDGPGIPTELREHVFERFTRLDDARDRDRGGAGLGLSIVHRIVDDHAGSIDIGDRPGGGAVITVVLPERRSDGADRADRR